jgi:hypothetical protein
MKRNEAQKAILDGDQGIEDLGGTDAEEHSYTINKQRRSHGGLSLLMKPIISPDFTCRPT